MLIPGYVNVYTLSSEKSDSEIPGSGYLEPVLGYPGHALELRYQAEGKVLQFRVHAVSVLEGLRERIGVVDPHEVLIGGILAPAEYLGEILLGLLPHAAQCGVFRYKIRVGIRELPVPVAIIEVLRYTHAGIELAVTVNVLRNIEETVAVGILVGVLVVIVIEVVIVIPSVGGNSICVTYPVYLLKVLHAVVIPVAVPEGRPVGG